MLQFGLFFKCGVMNWFTNQITKCVNRKFQGRSAKCYEVPDWSFEVSFSTSKFPIRVSKLGARLNRFNSKGFFMFAVFIQRVHHVLMFCVNITEMWNYQTQWL